MGREGTDIGGRGGEESGDWSRGGENGGWRRWREEWGVGQGKKERIVEWMWIRKAL